MNTLIFTTNQFLIIKTLIFTEKVILSLSILIFINNQYLSLSKHLFSLKINIFTKYTMDGGSLLQLQNARLMRGNSTIMKNLQSQINILHYHNICFHNFQPNQYFIKTLIFTKINIFIIRTLLSIKKTTFSLSQHLFSEKTISFSIETLFFIKNQYLSLSKH